MLDRETALPLTFGLIFAVGLHLAAAAGYVELRRSAATPTTPEPRPDLTIEQLSAGPPRRTNEPTELRVTLVNKGDKPAAPHTLALQIDQRTVAAFPLHQPLQPGETTQRTVRHAVRQPGPHELTAIADPDDAVRERNETNNRRSIDRVWLKPGASRSARPDLTPFALTAEKPRIPGRPTTVSARLANLGGRTQAPMTMRLLLDGKTVAERTVKAGVPTGHAVKFAEKITVEKPGKHELTVVADPDEQVSESDEGNNATRKTFEWSKPKRDEIRPGQDKKEKVTINWISHESYRKLLARKGKLDQPAVQRTTEPSPQARRMPEDPTPPAPSQRERPRSARAAASEPSKASDQAPPAPERDEAQAGPERAKRAEARAADPPQPNNSDTAPTGKTASTAQPPSQPEPAGAPETEPAASTGSSPQAPPSRSTAREPRATDGGRDGSDRRVALATPPLQPSPAGEPLLPDTPPAENEQRAPGQQDPPPSTGKKTPKQPAEQPQSGDTAQPKEAREDKPQPAKSTKATEPQSPAGKSEAAAEADQQQRPTKAQQNQKTSRQQRTEADKPEQSPSDGEAQQQPRRSARPSKANPTAAPKDTREAPPAAKEDNLMVRPGRVVARRGVRIETVHPRFSPVALMAAAPANPEVELTFSPKDGEVLDAKMLRSTGYDNVDGPILASLYKWKATGERLEKIDEPFTLRFRLLLGASE